MQKLLVELGDRSYPVFIGAGLLDRPECLLPFIRGSQVLVVSNETVAPLYLERLLTTLAGKTVATCILPDGERFKDMAHLDHIFTTLLEQRFSRNCTLIALGGGVVGDMTGFAAACYQRGVGFVQVPTTLLAQVDSSVGGKTGVNHPRGKNMIGAFKQPLAVLADTAVLASLPPRELSAGLAEVIKYGLLHDLAFLVWIEAHIERLRALDPVALGYAINRSCQIKVEIVAADEQEQNDRRALLNLGHTFGHAIEAALGYGEWLHGEAVAAGMLMAADLSWRLGWISQGDVVRVRALLVAAGLPVAAPASMSPDIFLEHMAVDKKNVDGRLRLILLRRLGEAVVSEDASPALLRETLVASGHPGASR